MPRNNQRMDRNTLSERKNQMTDLISVIMPIYKVEPYLRRAVDSVLNQTYKNIQVILVNDGSPDDCSLICDEYARKDSRVMVIHKENGGLSDARNAGLLEVKGEYVAFVDSDDYLTADFLEILYQACITTNSDISICQYKEVSGEELESSYQYFSDIPEKNITAYNRKELLCNLYDYYHKDSTYFVVAWNKLYKKSLWDGITYPLGRIHEDEATTYKIFDRAEKGIYISVPLYGYFQAPGSITRTQFSLKRLDWMTAMKERIEFFEERGETECLSYAYRALADASIHYYKQLSEALPDADVELNKLKNLVRGALKNAPKYGRLPLKTRIGYFLFLYDTSLYYFILFDEEI